MPPKAYAGRVRPGARCWLRTCRLPVYQLPLPSVCDNPEAELHIMLHHKPSAQRRVLVEPGQHGLSIWFTKHGGSTAGRM